MRIQELNIMQEISSNIHYIGAQDDNLDLFEGQYPLTAGISYNSYLVDDEKVAIFDAVDMRRLYDWLVSITETLGRIGAAAPDYLIVQHVEPDHAGCIGALIDRYPGIQLVCTAKAAGMLSQFFDGIDFASRCTIVADGDTLSLGRTNLKFFTAPMVHWPEVMVTLDTTDGVLFSADAFGTFAMYGDHAGGWDDEARRYYANIVGRFGASVQMLLKKLRGETFTTVAPLHGPVLSDDLAHYWTLYDKWSRYEPESEGTLIAYASVYGGTALAARRLADMLRSEGCRDVVLMDLCRHDVSYAVAEAFRLRRLVLCSVTYDGDLFPALHAFLHHFEAKKLSGRRVGLIENGSWAPVAGRLMADALGRMKDMTLVAPAVTLRSTLHDSDEPALQALAREILK